MVGSPYAVAHYTTEIGLHEKGVKAHMPLQVAPLFLTPSTSPRLGIKSQHQELHRYAFNGFLGPSSELTIPTRILHHFMSILIITFLSICIKYNNCSSFSAKSKMYRIKTRCTYQFNLCCLML